MEGCTGGVYMDRSFYSSLLILAHPGSSLPLLTLLSLLALRFLTFLAFPDRFTLFDVSRFS